jgi:phosphomevalonate kinase
MLRLKVPGNLLLAGEYLVLEEGGPGLALAIEPGLILEARTASEWSLTAIMGPDVVTAVPGDGGSPLLDAIFAQAAIDLAANRLAFPRPCAITLDSSAFFLPGGRKAGYGSSAAAAVALASLLVQLSGAAAGDTETGTEMTDHSGSGLPLPLLIALEGHRSLQGGRGSGYDIFTSYHGGFGLFTGGRTPSWRALDAESLPDLAVFPGISSVGSSNAVLRYQEMKFLKDAKLSSGVGHMRLAVEAYVDGSIDFDETLRRARQAGICIGDIIGVDAMLYHDYYSGDCFCKALGAGNELGLVVHPLHLPDVGSALEIKKRLQPVCPALGITWL